MKESFTLRQVEGNRWYQGRLIDLEFQANVSISESFFDEISSRVENCSKPDSENSEQVLIRLDASNSSLYLSRSTFKDLKTITGLFSVGKKGIRAGKISLRENTF